MRLRAGPVVWATVLVAVCALGSRGHAAADDKTVTLPVEVSTRTVRTEESRLADIVADALRALERADVALVAAASFSDCTIPAGAASAEDISKCLVFRADTVVVMRLTGQQIRRALEHGLSLYPARNAAFLQVSGIAATIQVAEGKRPAITAIKVGKEPLEEARTYTVAMPSPLAAGALLFSRIWTRGSADRDTGKTLEQAVAAYVASEPAVSRSQEERLAFRR
jgi:2',3'-cyclic-nucleotide 2'-phosphodiesterase (5'-nucleotidase family)